MDAASIAKEIADHLQGRDDIARTLIAQPLDEKFASIMVTTQGGAYYDVRVVGPGLIETETAAGEGE